MQHSQQSIKRMDIELLKNLRDVSVEFATPGLTAIMGVNGSGKSTILHALACCYKPLQDGEREDYKFSMFFTPNPDSLWRGSRFTMVHDYRQGQQFYENQQEVFTKPDRWSPKYSRRISRHVIFLGIRTCAPAIELESKSTFIHYGTTPRTGDLASQIRIHAGQIMNREYDLFNDHRTTRSRFIGVRHQEVKYSALSMGAGEQRIFKILEAIFGAPRNALIIIDEIDLLLHPSALKRLLVVIYNRAIDKNIQIVFSTHSPVLFEMIDIVKTQHIIQTPNRTLRLDFTTPDIIYRITGESIKPLELYVEDPLAKTIVQHVAREVGILSNVQAIPYGAAINCFTVVAGLLLSGHEINNSLFILDGDRYTSNQEKINHVNEVLTGNDQTSTELRNRALRGIVQLNLPPDYAPEKYIWHMICNLPDEFNQEEIKQIAQNIENTGSHDYVNEVINRLGLDYQVGLSQVVSFAANSCEWSEYVRPVREWLIAKKEELHL
ncbi:MAG: AAA family ATPase [Syntrophomonas sp.]